MSPQADKTFKDYPAASPQRILFGIVVIVFSLNGLLRYIVKNNPGPVINSYLCKVASFPDYLYDQSPISKYFLFTALVHWLIVSVIIFFILLTITSLRHGSLSFLFSGYVGFIGGLSFITIITLLLYSIYWLFVFIRWVFIVIRSIVLYILSWILWPPVLYVLGVIAVVAVILLVLYNLVFIAKMLIALVRYILSSLPKIILYTVMLAATVWLLRIIYGIVYPILPIFIVFLR